MIHFTRPYFLILFAIVLPLLWQLYRSSSAGHRWSTVCDAHLLPALLQSNAAKTKRILFFVFSLSCVLIIIALSGPSWQRQTIPVYRSANATLMVMDMSPSMLAEDIKPNRVTRAKFKILDFLKRYREGQVGFVAFSEYAYVVTPLTQDPDTLSALIPELSPMIMPKTGSNIAAGLEKALTLLKSGLAPQGHVVLITDSEPDEQASHMASKIKNAGYSLDVYTIGTEKGAPIPVRDGYLENEVGDIIIAKLPQAKLSDLATTGGGRLISFSQGNQDVEQLLSITQAAVAKQNSKEKHHSNQWHDDGIWFVWALLPLALLAFRKGWFEGLADA